jgi:hypothetical protein
LRRFATALTMAMAGTAAMAAAADAATVAIDPVVPCYLAGDEVAMTGTGFTAGGAVDVTIDGKSLGGLTADPSGNIAATITLGGMKAVKSHTLTATETANPANTASVTYTGTTLQVTVKPKNARAGKRLKLRGYGFLAGPKVYMHVRGHGYSADQLVGRPAQPCGTWSARKHIVPSTASPGKYKVQFDAKKKYSKKTKPRVRGTMTVFRTFSAFGGVGLPMRWTQVAG